MQASFNLNGEAVRINGHEKNPSDCTPTQTPTQKFQRIFAVIKILKIGNVRSISRVSKMHGIEKSENFPFSKSLKLFTGKVILTVISEFVTCLQYTLFNLISHKNHLGMNSDMFVRFDPVLFRAIFWNPPSPIFILQIHITRSCDWLHSSDLRFLNSFLYYS